MEKAEQIDGSAHQMRATMQEPQTVEPLQREALASQQNISLRPTGVRYVIDSKMNTEVMQHKLLVAYP